jgi:hypothetical protein
MKDPITPAALQRLFGYWLVCIGSLGIQYAIGSIYVVVLDTFDSTRGEAALVGALCAGLMDGLGALSGVVVQQIGSRTACLLGALLACIGLAASAAAKVWWHLLFTFSLLVGVGHRWLLVLLTHDTRPHTHPSTHLPHPLANTHLPQPLAQRSDRASRDVV